MHFNTPLTLDLALAPNHLYYGDCFEVMGHWPDESVDTVYGDPPFNSKATYSVLWGEDASKQKAQLDAFTDMWTWGAEAEQRLKRMVRDKHPALRAIRSAPERSGMAAYLIYMAERLTEMKRVLKPTGAIYLHCDGTAGHYLKLLMDTIFGPENFRNDIVWHRTGGAAKGNQYAPRKLGASKDYILFYAMPKHKFNGIYVPDPDVAERYPKVDEKGRQFALTPLWRVQSMGPSPSLCYEWRGHTNPHPSGWRVTKANLEQLYQQGRVYFSAKETPYRIRYMDEDKGIPLDDVWTDIGPLGGRSKERLGYPTQKPLALLERIVTAASNEEELILDPFCGCGTTMEAGLKLGRQVVGIDVSMFALDLVNNVRFAGKYPALPIKGIPTDFDSAERLAQTNPFQFEKWAVWQTGMMPNVRQTGDSGVDGQGVLVATPEEGYTALTLAQVKGGKARSYAADVERFCYTLTERNAACGVFITLRPIGKRSSVHATAGKFGRITIGNATYPRLQFWSIQEFYAHGTRPNLPPLVDPYKDRTAQTLLDL